MSKINKLLLASLMLIVFVGAGCGIQNSNTDNKQVKNVEPIKIGFIGPLTGDVAGLGEVIKAGVEVAEKEINRAGGIDGRKVKVIFEDGACSGKTAVSAANKLVSVDKVKFMIAGMCSDETLAIAPILEANKIISISPVSTNPDVAEAGDYIFRNIPSDSFQGNFVANHIKNELGKTKVAILFNSDGNWSAGIKNAFKEKFLELGGIIVAEESALSSSHDLRSQLNKIKNSDAEIIYFPSLVDSAIVGLKQIKELEIDIPVLGGDGWDAIKLNKEVGLAANGVKYTITSNAELPDYFLNGVKEILGTDDMNAYAPRAYDALNILVNAIKKVGDDPTAVKNELYNLKDYQGIADIYSMDANGDVSKASYDIKEFRDGEIIKVN